MEPAKRTPGTRKVCRSSRSLHTTIGSTVDTSAFDGYSLGETANSWAIWLSRLAFILCLACVAAALGYLSYYFLSESEMKLAVSQYDAVGVFASSATQENMVRKRLGTVSMASVIGGANPESSDWPSATLNNYEVIASNLIDTSKGCNMAFAPFVEVGELEAFEASIYDYYEHYRLPEPFPEGTAVKPFGKGVWSMDENGEPFHDTTGETPFPSDRKILAPMVHHNTGASKKLMNNLHSNPVVGPVIDDILSCAQEKAETEASLDECVAITPTMPNRTSWVQQVESGPGVLMITPVHASNDPTKAVGVVVTSVVWAEIMVSTYAESISGVDIVLTNNAGQIFTYYVSDGEAHFIGEGDLHDPRFDSFAIETQVTPTDMFAPNSIEYTTVVYPTQAFYHVYCTDSPMLATIGAVCIILVTSLMFLAYDLFVRREFNARKELLEAKRAFCRFVSHEVRTPLNSVYMGLKIMTEELSEALKAGGDIQRTTCESWMKLSNEITTNTSSAVDVLNDFLNYDKIESGKLSLERSVVPIFDLIESTVFEFKLPAAKKNISVFLQTPLSIDKKGSRNCAAERFIVGDKVRLTQVFRNLISNAIKFTPQDGTIQVVAQWSEPTKKESKQKYEFDLAVNQDQALVCSHGGHLVLQVTDSGAGMTKEQIDSVFHQGSQFNVNTLQGGNGSGLGTYIAKGIVRQHNGTLSASSEGLKKGSTFYVRLPLHKVPLEEAPSLTSFSRSRSRSGSPDGFNESLKILVVDDAKMNLKLLMRLLQKHGHICDGVEDGTFAVEKVKEAMEDGKSYDCILMDYQMPLMDGPTAAQEIRKLGCDSFIVGVTGNVMQEDVKIFKDAGANAVLPKPLKMEDLEELWDEYDIKNMDEELGDLTASVRYRMSFSHLDL